MLATTLNSTKGHISKWIRANEKWCDWPVNVKPMTARGRTCVFIFSWVFDVMDRYIFGDPHTDG